MRELAIFDCDGVLVDSEPIALEVETAVLRAIGHPIKPEAFRDFALGRRRADINAELEAHWGRPLPADYTDRVRAIYAGELAARLRPVSGIDAVLRDLLGPRCVASSSGPAHIRRSLELTGLIGWFGDALFSAHAVALGKPAPDLFLHAAARMGADPLACVVVEDSRAGILGAKAAGMRAIGFVAGGHCGPKHGETLLAAGADAVASNAGELALLLG